METFASNYQRAIYVGGSYLIAYNDKEFGLYANTRGLFRNKFKTSLMARGTKEEIENWAQLKLYTRKELLNAYQERQESGSVSAEAEQKVEQSSVTSTGRAAGKASNRIQRNKGRRAMFLRRLSSKRSSSEE